MIQLYNEKDTIKSDKVTILPKEKQSLSTKRTNFKCKICIKLFQRSDDLN